MILPTGAIPVLPLKNTVVFAGVTHALRVGREMSLKAVDAALKNQNWIITAAQLNAEQNVEKVDDLYTYGTLCKIENVQGTHESGYTIIVRGESRVKIENYKPELDYFAGYAEQIEDIYDLDKNTQEALLRSLRELSFQILDLYKAQSQTSHLFKPQPPGTFRESTLEDLLNSIDDLSILTHLIAAHLDLSVKEKQLLLEMIHLKERSMYLLTEMQKHKESLIIQKEIKNKLQNKIVQNQRDHILREHLKTIKEELGEDPEETEVEKIKSKIDGLKLPPDAQKLVDQQTKKLSSLSPQSPEYNIIKSHLDLILELPWNTSSSDRKTNDKNSYSDFSLDRASEILDRAHFGLDKIKSRILQHLAVLHRNKNKKGTLLLLVGPPGVGKTSIGESLAEALNRKFYRISLGGIRDESEIRGHRRTYIGALPGKLISALKKVGENDPVILLDEIDKISRSYNGDPASALLEVLDPEQNHNFMDHYLDTAFDLSHIVFVATANSLETIPAPLLDRMEIIELSSYTHYEKLQIAKNHLLPKQIKEHDLPENYIQISDENLNYLIKHYTREAGVRDLQRKMAEICRFATEQIVRKEQEQINANIFMPLEISKSELQNIFGPEKFHSEVSHVLTQPGLVTGLAWTPVGGDILFIETALTPGKGDLIITGQLGEVMKESALIAKSLIKARLSLLNPLFQLNKFDIHLHVPAGAIPKDGPSAGVTLLTSLASLVTRKQVPSDLAMTGEINLSGQVLPVGGIKEKLLAAHRAGIKKIILSKRNEKDLNEIPEVIKKDLSIYLVNEINEVIQIAIGIDLKSWNEDNLIHNLNHSESLQSKIPST